MRLRWGRYLTLESSARMMEQLQRLRDNDPLLTTLIGVPAPIRELTAALVGNTTLKTLLLSGNNMGDAGACDVAGVLGKVRSALCSPVR